MPETTTPETTTPETTTPETTTPEPTSPDPTSWSALAPLPQPATLSSGYDRHQPSDAALHDELARLAGDVRWAALGWSELVDVLLSIGRTDVPLSRLVEGHADAQRILHQAGAKAVPGALYGVWASRSQQTGVTATRSGTAYVLDGTLRFASGLGVIDRALLPVWPDPDHHVLLDLPVTGGGDTWVVDDAQWVTSAMEVSRSHTVAVRRHPVPLTARVGPDDFYLSRPQFFPGGVGVAACWLGGATRVGDLVRARLRDPVPPALQLRLGALRSRLAGGAALLVTAASRLNETEGDGPLSRAISAEARWGVAEVVHDVLDQAHRIAGPAGLAYDRELTRAVHDLRLYVLQHNADADATSLAQPGAG
jgi:alkylation response protein AidB-like acyl-CoA dehydrogenase